MLAVVLLSINSQGKVLAVTRKGTSNDWGLPGGKVESNETSLEALHREVREETGCDVSEPLAIYESRCGNAQVTVYYGKVTGEPIPEKNSKVGWVPWGEILVGSFGEFNQKLYTTIFRKHKELLHETGN